MSCSYRCNDSSTATVTTTITVILYIKPEHLVASKFPVNHTVQHKKFC